MLLINEKLTFKNCTSLTSMRLLHDQRDFIMQGYTLEDYLPFRTST